MRRPAYRAVGNRKLATRDAPGLRAQPCSGRNFTGGPCTNNGSVEIAGKRYCGKHARG